MLGFAQKMGWIDPTGAFIQAHTEWPSCDGRNLWELIDARAAATPDLGQGPAASAAGSQEPSATSPGAPALSPPRSAQTLQTPVPTAVGVPVPNLQPSAELPPAATDPLDVLTNVLSGVPGTLP